MLSATCDRQVICTGVNVEAVQWVRTHDLLDAKESTGAFAFVGRVGWNGTLLVKSSVMLASIDGCRS
jgi:hypothetical protein